MGLLNNFIQDPRLAMAAGLLTPTKNSAFGPALLQGLQAANVQRQSNQRNQVSQQAVQTARSDAERRRKIDIITNAIRTGQVPMQQGLQALAALSNDPAAAFARLQPKPEATPNIVRVAQSIGLQPGTEGFNKFVREATLKPQNEISFGGQLPFKVPPGFQLSDPNNPAAGVAPIPGGPASRTSPEASAKTAMIANALELVPLIRNQVMPGGKVDRGLVTTLNMNAPFSDGRLARQRIADAVEAKLRAESGAAVPQTEVERASARFVPSPLDSDAGIRDKLNRLEKFLKSSLKLTNPELLERLTTGDRKTEFTETRRVNGKTFMKDTTGTWFEVTPDGP